MKDTTRPRRPWLQRWSTLGVALGLAVALGWLWPREDEDTQAPPRLSAEPAPSAARATRRAPAGPAEQPGLPASAPSRPASRPADPGTAPRAPAPLSPDQLAQIEKQWCTHGLKAHQQVRQALERAHPLRLDGEKLDGDAPHARWDAMLREVGTQAMLAVDSRLKRQWILQLRQRGDLRSQAAADYLQITMSDQDKAPAVFQHLLSLAQSSRDPLIFMTWQVARSDCVLNALCSALPMTDWRTLDSGNLLAWLPTRASGQYATELDWDAIAHTRFANSYLEDFQALLLPLLDQEPPGLGLQQGLALISRLNYSWPSSAGALALGRSCLEASETQPQRRATCVHAADLLWRSPSAGLLEYKFATAMAALAGAGAQSPWAERLAFVKGLSAADGQRLMDLEYPGNRDGQSCETQAEQRRQLKERVRNGLWAAALGSEGARRVP